MLLIEKIVLNSINSDKKSLNDIYQDTKLISELLRIVLVNLIKLGLIEIDLDKKFFVKNKKEKKVFDIKVQNNFIGMINEFYISGFKLTLKKNKINFFLKKIAFLNEVEYFFYMGTK